MVDEEPLAPGMNAERVVRIGSTVRRPTGHWTPAVHAFLRYLEQSGYEAAPRVLGIDEQGREMLTHVTGTTPSREHFANDDRLHGIAELVGRLHALAAAFVPPRDAQWRPIIADPGGGEVILHGDLGLWNVLVAGDSVTFIDWDDAGPGRTEWETGYCLLSFANLFADAAPSDAEATHRIRVFADGYGVTSSQLEVVLDLVPQRCRWMHDGIIAWADLGNPPQLRMRDAGVHEAWAATADSWDARLPSWKRLLS